MNNLEVRYVFDIGSGTTKSAKVLFNKDTNKIVEILDKKSISVPYQQYILDSKDGYLSEEAMKEGEKAFKTLLDYYGISSNDANIRSVATEWARNGKNAQEYINNINKSLGLNISIISQKDEGELGLKALLSSDEYSNNASKMLVVDIGGGSMQLSYLNTNKSISVFNGNGGSVKFSKFIHNILKLPEDRLLTTKEMMKCIDLGKVFMKYDLENFEGYLNLKAKAGVFYGIGQLINSGIQPMVEKDSITKMELYDLLMQYGEHSVEELHEMYPNSKPEFTILQQTNLLLVYSLMNEINAKELKFVKDVSSLDAIASDSKIWEHASSDISGNATLTSEDIDLAGILHAHNDEMPTLDFA